MHLVQLWLETRVATFTLTNSALDPSNPYVIHSLAVCSGQIEKSLRLQSLMCAGCDDSINTRPAACCPHTQVSPWYCMVLV